MGPRKRIGLIFDFAESWTGGVYYLFNIINALKTLPDGRKPKIIVFYNKGSSEQDIRKLNYPFLEFLPLHKSKSIFSRIIVRVRRILGDKEYYPQYPRDTVDFVFPCTSAWFESAGSLRLLRKVYWISDFQHKYLPHFFSKQEAEERDKIFDGIASLKCDLVLSSENAKHDFMKFYPDASPRLIVMPFATVLPPFRQLRMEDLKKKYGIGDRYFISPNQFWAHKNHMVMLKAMLLLKEKGHEIQLLLTGRETDYRNPGYSEKLKEFVNESGLFESVLFLGFIDRTELMRLMSDGLAVIQPSLFEGWSTVVEDAKAIGQSLILSSIDVHKEQCGENAIYFDPNSEINLAEKMEEAMSPDRDIPKIDYDECIRIYAESISAL